MRLVHTRFTVTAGAIVMDSSNRVLLLQHRFRAGSGWGIPGGFIEAGEQPLDAMKRELQEEVPLDAMKRELQEEVGLIIESAEVAGAQSFPAVRQVEILFLCSVSDAQIAVMSPTSPEILDAQWFSLDGLPAGLPSDQQTLLKNILLHGAKRPD